jgi:hypothetical protein
MEAVLLSTGLMSCCTAIVTMMFKKGKMKKNNMSELNRSLTDDKQKLNFHDYDFPNTRMNVTFIYILFASKYYLEVPTREL